MPRKKKGCSHVLPEERLEAEAAVKADCIAVPEFPVNNAGLVEYWAPRTKKCRKCNTAVRIPSLRDMADRHPLAEKSCLCPNCEATVNY